MINLQEKHKLYFTFRVKKPNGRYRIIQAPCGELKAEQKKLSKRLEKIALSEFCNGFRKGFSISNATELHINKRWILKVDIKNFFPSIRSEKLTFLTCYEKDIATLDGKLVQGSPCSPIISNIVLKNLDNKFGKYFKKFDISFSRYADDLLISGIGDYHKEYLDFIKENLKFNGFLVNKQKVKLMYKNERMEALGVTLNGTNLSCNREYRKVIRAKINKGNVTGRELGYLSYINSINKVQYDRLFNGIDASSNL